MPDLSPALIAALQEQHNFEMAEFLAYRQIRNNLHNTWRGAHKYFHMLSDEESEDANKIEHYLLHRFVNPVYTDIPAAIVPDGSIMRPCFQFALDMEEAESERLNALCYLAEQEEDPETCVFLDDLIRDQTMEIFNLKEILHYLDISGDVAALWLLDQKLREMSEKEC